MRDPVEGEDVLVRGVDPVLLARVAVTADQLRLGQATHHGVTSSLQAVYRGVIIAGRGSPAELGWQVPGEGPGQVLVVTQALAAARPGHSGQAGHQAD